MGGRSTFVGFIALAIAMLGVGTFAAPRSAMAEIRVPLPGSEKRPVKRRRFVRPSRPSRNPTRVVASVSAAAVSPKIADNSEAAVVAGTSSSASVALALRAPARAKKNETEAPEPDAAVADVVASDDSRKDETAKDDTAKDETVEDTSISDAADTANENVASADAADDEVKPDRTASAEDPQDEDVASAETDTTEADPTETASIETVKTPVETDDTQKESSSDADSDPTSVVQAHANEATVEEPVETAAAEETEASEPEQSSKSEDVEVIDEVTGKPDVAAQEPALSIDGTSVVLQVAPPPEDVLNATDSSEDGADIDTSPVEATSDEEPDDAAETKMAALTPPNAPAADVVDAPAADVVDAPAAGLADETEATAEDVPSEDVPSAEEETETDATAQGAAAATDERDATGDTDPDTAEAAEDSDAAERSNQDVVIAVSEPPPPPAHPVIAAVREKLEESGKFRGLAASDLTALKTFYGEHEEPPLWITEAGFSQKAKTIMTTIAEADDWGLDASAFDLPTADAVPATEEAQADAEIALLAAILSYARDAQIGRLTPSRVSKLFDQHPKRRDPKTVLTEIGASDAPERSLVSLHPQHTQLKRLQQALVLARDSARITGRDPKRDRNVQLIVMNMERWRWLPRQLGNYYVWNNVPEFDVRVVKGGQTIYQEKTIVGQYKYATPFFSAPMRDIVVHPNWTVPPTIVKEDIAPKLQGPSGGAFFAQSKNNVLRRYGLAVSYKGEPINADTVDWNNVNVHKYTFTQDPGPANVLGQFKFNFPNKHAIYMHDTVQPELFAQRTRTLSHGCIRVRQPDRLAALLLSEDKGWSPNQVRSVVARNETKVISFNKRVPVHLTYFTATVDENGTVRDFTDIYGIDSRMAPKLFENPEYFPVPAVSTVAETGPGTRPSQSGRRTTNNGLDDFLTGLFGN